MSLDPARRNLCLAMATADHPMYSSPSLILLSPAATVQLALGKRIVKSKLKEEAKKNLALIRWLEPLVANNCGYVVYFLLSKGRTLQSLRPNLPFFACSCCCSNISRSLGSALLFCLFSCYPWNYEVIQKMWFYEFTPRVTNGKDKELALGEEGSREEDGVFVLSWIKELLEVLKRVII